MNIDDTSNNGTVIEPLNSANSPQSEQASCPFYSVVHYENMAVTNLPLLNPAADVYEGLQPQQHDTTVTQNLTNHLQQDWVAEPDSDKQALVDSEFQKLLALNEELTTANGDLYSQVEQLKQELAEAEKILQWQKKRSSVTDSMLNQQTQELSAAQEQIQSLFQQLETAVQTVQHQEIFIDTHKAQLQISQQRLAQLERECSLLQTNYSEQSQQLLHSENTCREFQSRLMRQQRQTLQFKAALEKCLDTSVPSYDTLEYTPDQPQGVTGGQTRFSRKARSLFPNAQPIKPWSAEADIMSGVCDALRQNTDNSVAQASAPCSHTKNYSTPTAPFSESKLDEEFILTPTQLASLSAVDDSVIKSETVSTPSCSNLDQQLESLIQRFFVSPPIDDVQSNQADTPIGEPLAFTWENGEEPQITREQDLETEDLRLSPTPEPQVTSTSRHKETNAVETEDYWSEVSPSTSSKLPLHNFFSEPLTEYPQDHKSPSPVIYPQRPPKGRKSFASVELPNFRPSSHESKINGESSD
ncbi:hypothetical protein [Anabaena sp. PCC 7108]|uniref:hypothetical protein n=1 Tax=Anabaena sp. PCC 7108 TaxID=163908 RepID=UPI00034DBAD9|nr:hypothetical protein [Anabaena sp. PCC 7108]